MKKHLYIFLVLLCPIFVLSQNVGIGTTLPPAKLTINGTADSPSIPGAASTGVFRIGISSTDGIDFGKMVLPPYSGWIQAGAFGNVADPLSLQPLGGNVGIGLLSPSEKLEVAGNVKVAGIISGVIDPISAQDAATKAYVDNNDEVNDADADSMNEIQQLSINGDTTFIEGGNYIIVDGLRKVEVLYNLLIDSYTVQQRLDAGETPIDIYNSDNSLLDSLYGKTYQGGLIAYLNTTTGTGLVAATVDQSTGAEWGCYGDLIGGTSDAIGTGQANTTLIVGGCSESGIAARLCDDLDDWGYDDWFLPSKDELDELYVNLKLNGFGGFSIEGYWSSTETDNTGAWLQSFYNGNEFNIVKNGNNSVRAVRAF